MLNIEIPQRVIGIINHTLPILRKRLEQFVSQIFVNTVKAHFNTAIELIEKALFDFAEDLSRKFLQAMSASVLHTISALSNESQGLSQMQELVNNQIGIFEIYSESSHLRSSIINNFGNIKLEQEKEQAIAYKFRALVEGDDGQEIKKFQSQIIAQILQHQGKQLLYFANDLIQELNQIHKEINIQKQSIEIQLEQIGQSSNQLIDQQLADSKQLKRKRKQEKKKNTQCHELYFKQTKEQDKLNKLKKRHFNRIIKMKQKYGNIRRKLFKEQLQVLWLFKLTNKQIKEKIMNCKKSKLKFLRNQFRQWRKQLQKRTLQVDQTCHIHKDQIFYLCLHQTIKKDVYLCNQCFQDTTILRKHYNHEIICKKHRKTIKYKKCPQFQRIDEQFFLQEQQTSKELQQKFLCQQCPHSYTKRVSICHYQQIRLLCIQQKCVQMGVYMICSVCESANHKNHSVVEYNKHKMMEQFRMSSTIDVAQYEQLLIKAKGMLSFSLFQKLKRILAEEALPIIIFLEAFGVYSSEQVEKRINKFIAQQQREDLMVLTSALRVKEMYSPQESRLNYLQVLNSMFEAEFQAIVQFISERMKQSCVRMNETMNRSKEQVEAELNRKYRQIINIDVDDKLVASPMRLRDVNPLHYKRIEKITIKKERELQRDQNIEREQRNRRAVFFKQISNKLFERNVREDQHQKYIQLIIIKKYDDTYYEEKYFTLNQKQRKIFDYLLDQFKHASSLENIRECLLLKQITSNKFNHLRAIHIQYCTIEKQFSPFLQYKYSFDSYALFEFISNNAQLLQVTIKGVQIYKIQQFIQQLSTNNLNHQRIKKNTHLRLAINFQYQLRNGSPNESNISPFVSRLQNLCYFRQQFQELSQVTVRIEFKGGDWRESFERLLQCLKTIRKIQIQIWDLDYRLLKQLLSGLSSLTEITLLSFYRIYFRINQTILSAEDYSSMEVSLTALFSRNTITHLKLNDCFDFPSLPKITTLQSIYFQNSYFKDEFDLGQFIKANTKLKQITIIYINYGLMIEEQLFNQLQYLSIKGNQYAIWLNSLPFAHPSSYSSKIKRLSIQDKRMNLSTLQPIFPKLANIVQLYLIYLDFDYQHLSIISSNHLETLYIQSNNKITDECLQLADSKWPYLKHITLVRCPLITERIFSLCRFKGLIWIYVEPQKLSMLGRRHLMKRGIQLKYYL